MAVEYARRWCGECGSYVMACRNRASVAAHLVIGLSLWALYVPDIKPAYAGGDVGRPGVAIFGLLLAAWGMVYGLVQLARDWWCPRCAGTTVPDRPKQSR